MPRTSGQASLFERLEPDAPPRRVGSRQETAAARVHAIKRHLELILNSRRGCSLSTPELGLRDFNDAAIGSDDLLLRVSQDIRQSVAQFEPRVRVMAVRACPDASRPLDLTFRLDCMVPLANAEELVEIDLIIHRPDRRAQIL
jgi:type VI secretion system protein